MRAIDIVCDENVERLLGLEIRLGYQWGIDRWPCISAWKARVKRCLVNSVRYTVIEAAFKMLEYSYLNLGLEVREYAQKVVLIKFGYVAGQILHERGKYPKFRFGCASFDGNTGCTYRR